MGFKLNAKNFNNALEKLSQNYNIYAPKVFVGKGRSSETDMVRYGQVNTIEEIEFNKKKCCFQ